MKKQTKWVRTREEWYPTIQGGETSPNPDYNNPLPDPAVRVSFMRLLTKEPLWRVCLWGGDDFGMEIDTPDREKAEALYERIKDFTTQAELESWGFGHA